MIQTLQKEVTFDEFIAWYPENTEHRYELHDGVIVEMPKPKGKHSKLAGFIIAELNFILRQYKLPFFIPRECIIKSVDGKSGYEPDVIVLDEAALVNEPRWEAESVITQGNSVKLIIEVVSTNWRDDYFRKLGDYEELGIPEYWIFDYLALGGRNFIGSPKQPTISVYELVDGEYQVAQFRGNENLKSPIFPELNLTVEQIFQL
ncbi:Uma2 family endonuclease [Sphaerospermopsis aphanizomenoides BCCUSP55]|uniref:Uma2 family endonuclease n=1 Tax=Sphaerospermopsis aphanizomenoides TaxID=459663 RepID=UPI0019056B58|nr:Uma2 family endonuclease [Sphaerospermopsis aphanizomenoides]MBK1987297.1 Uma2 family endonuclease [Sphaerospermopsis aphanizomenoides BCCUSP55]